MVKEGYKMLYQMPALAGYGGWWELSEPEAEALAEPTARLLKRMSPKAQEAFSRFFDPIALAFTAVVITLPRVQQTQGALMVARRKMETQERLTRGLSTARTTAGGNGETSKQGASRDTVSEDNPGRKDVGSGRSESVKDAFD